MCGSPCRSEKSLQNRVTLFGCIVFPMPSPLSCTKINTVELETYDYKRVSDKLNDFIDECLEPSDGFAVTSKAVYARYKEWCSSCGYACEGKQKFMDKLRTRGMLANTGTIDGKTVRNVVNGFSIYSEYNDISL